MKVIFAGTPEFAREALAALHRAGHTIPLVLTQPDRPAGRGLHVQPSPVKRLATELAIPVAQPPGLRLDGRHADAACAAHERLRSTPHDVMVVAAYGLILPQSVLDIPPQGCINIHASLLPRWRGAAPIQRAIEAGDTETGITIMRMDAGLDTGPMLLKQAIPIDAADTAATLHDKLARLGGTLIVDALARLSEGRLAETPQPVDGVTYAAKIGKEEAALDFSQPATVLMRKIRALNPFPGAYAILVGEMVKFWNASAVENEDADNRPGNAAAGRIGEILAADAHGLRIRCGNGILEVTELQRSGGKRLEVARFLAGHPLHVGACFESVSRKP